MSINIEEAITFKKRQGERKREKKRGHHVDPELNILINQEPEETGREVYNMMRADKKTVWKKGSSG